MQPMQELVPGNAMNIIRGCSQGCTQQTCGKGRGTFIVQLNSSGYSLLVAMQSPGKYRQVFVSRQVLKELE